MLAATLLAGLILTVFIFKMKKNRRSFLNLFEHKRWITIPEGYTRFDIANRLEQNQICARSAFLDESQEDEGFLFPATYLFGEGEQPKAIVAQMKAEFNRRYAALSVRYSEAMLRLSQDLGWGEKQIVTLASIVEKEAVVDEERPLIASVFFNRLTDKKFEPKLLQSDPTAGYGCQKLLEMGPKAGFESLLCMDYKGKIVPAMLRDTLNMYNTYTHAFLPPGPICNPGIKSIEAVLAPAQTRFFYFVSLGQTKPGYHYFSETYESHREIIKQNQMR